MAGQDYSMELIPQFKEGLEGIATTVKKGKDAFEGTIEASKQLGQPKLTANCQKGFEASEEMFKAFEDLAKCGEVLLEYFETIQRATDI